ncbi:hypothetical protein IZ6_18670 [Terrihabitans soli]|uniref:DUF3572 family protein n=1 Tax=Terrihabitans soli TaxID=708113 RepID=A0A6S6QV41_9HYPH|nr:DUF3572 domain-containing protein [Terrihabitans soli]BCJ91132.1 hypothetical protein IZ6_18670 [Terrihabitans soli]
MQGNLKELKNASELAVSALVFLAADPERLGRFLALSGIDPQTIRLAAKEPGFLAGVLEHISGDEKLLLAFAEENQVRPQEVSRARALLAGPMPE